MGLEEPTPCLPGHQGGGSQHISATLQGVAAAPVLPCPSSQLQAGPVVSPGRLEHTCTALWSNLGALGTSTPCHGRPVFGTRIVQGI